MAIQRKHRPCKFFSTRSGCRYGDTCKFEHDKSKDSRSSADSASPRQRPKSTLTPVQSTFREWRFNIPKDRMQVSLGSNLPDFFRTACDLVNNGDDEIQQQVIESLASEGGLSRIQEIEAMLSCEKSPTRISALVESILMPFFKTITHPRIISSFLLEIPQGRVLNFLWGLNGRRAIKLFDYALAHFKSLNTSSSVTSQNIYATAVALDRLVEQHTAGQVTEELNTVLSILTALITDAYTAPPSIGKAEATIGQSAHIPEMDSAALMSDALRLLGRLSHRLELGASIPTAKDQHKSLHTPHTFFNIGLDGPGDLSKSGPRHDNDHEDFTKIQILPTPAEIESSRNEYLPVRDSNKHHRDGLEGLLDRQFRLLREDTIGQLRDAVRTVIHDVRDPSNKTKHVGQYKQATRTNVYHDVRLEDLTFTRLTGLQAYISFRQPKFLTQKSKSQRQQWWESSNKLLTDSLLCLVDEQGAATYFTICDDNSTAAVKTGRSKQFYEDSSRVRIALRLVEPFAYDINRLVEAFFTQRKAERVLCEFPGILLPSFYPTLSALQLMCKTKDLPFVDLIAPSSTVNITERVPPPLYACKPGFRFELKSLIGGEKLEMVAGEPFNFEKLQASSTLDAAQQVAVATALTTSLALIQGPPGTGKSYTGVGLIKVLLDNARKAELGPIICVCYTNHALDQLLENLVKDGVEGIIRIGSRSQSKILANLNLREVAQKTVNTNVERRTYAQNRDGLDGEAEYLKSILRNIARPGSVRAIKSHLQRTNPSHFQELFETQTDSDGFEVVSYDTRNELARWLSPKQGEKQSKAESDGSEARRSVEELNSTSLWAMSVTERQKLHEHWMGEILARNQQRAATSLNVALTHKRALDVCRQESDLRCLRVADIIGVTTSGLARNLELLRRLDCKVLLCEEAGEVLEAHLLTAMLPSIEHAILIGDHQQLRPQIENYELRSDNPRGKQFSLDISLFERLVRPTSIGSRALPFSTLEVQRRMHPKISYLIKETLYPKLQDHVSVIDNPEVIGFSKRLFWLDHNQPEASSESELSTSYSNEHEVELVAAFVTHLIRQGAYRGGDIAVLTPYLGQLVKLKQRLAQSYEIIVGDRDLEELDKKGLYGELGAYTGLERVQKSTLLQALRVATVDNFQGEEAKVVIVSLVRNNEDRKCGFLKTTNRINVLLSRAQHGMYLIGNSDTYKHILMWNQVISMLEHGGNIGNCIGLCCPRHPESPIEAATADEFALKSPEGGCDLICKQRLSCGHTCVKPCHSDVLHAAVVCLVDCPRKHAGCDHPCPKKCGDECGLCRVKLPNIQLVCGHVAETLECYKAQNLSVAVCNETVQQKVPGCGHIITIPCWKEIGADFTCPAECGAAIACSHSICRKKCGECRTRDRDGNIMATDHGRCKQPCSRSFGTCGHRCKYPCHDPEPCPLCTAKCAVKCPHSECSKGCCEPCAPCAEDCAWSCPHRGRCDLPCAVPCDILPCSERCQKLLTCGHQCPSLCGEVCPPEQLCHICCSDDVRGKVVDWTLLETYGSINIDQTPCLFPQCGHPMTVESADSLFEFSRHYEISADGSVTSLKGTSDPFSADEPKSCPNCRYPLRNINRYNRITRRSLIDQATKKFISWSNAAFVPLTERLHKEEAYLSDPSVVETQRNLVAGASKFIKDNSSFSGVDEIVWLQGSLDQAIGRLGALPAFKLLYSGVLKVRRAIHDFLRQVTEEEQPFGRIYELVQDRHRRQLINESTFVNDTSVIQIRGRLLATSLALRCDLLILTNALMLQSRCLFSITSTDDQTPVKLGVDFSTARASCLIFASECLAKDQRSLEVEARIYFARFAALESSCTAIASDKSAMSSKNAIERSTKLTQEGRGQLALARGICERYPGQTRGLRDELEAAETMFRDSTFYLPVTSEERRAVYQAMTRDFRGTGHWYYCENGHPFTVGECGMPMQTSRCPECGAPVGGTHHESVEGVQRAEDIDETFGRMGLGN